ncbi:MAG TPA: peptide ABC transporter substrate-binding protein [Chlamydiales bacterium]|nr:peptide ABC transporter substrate-binding protein [Chlamydiales bacterium]
MLLYINLLAMPVPDCRIRKESFKRRVFIFAVFFLYACNPSPAPPAALRLAFNAPPQTLDPRKSADFLSSTLICLLYDGLTRCAPGGGIEPALAEKWTISPDGKTYTFFLRKAFWSNGKVVTAFDFERSWKKILDPSFLSPSVYLLFSIKNGEKCAKNEATSKDVGICALDERTLQVELEHPTPYFLSLTAFPLFLPAPEDEVSGSIFNGPFCIEKFHPNHEIILVKNHTFWNANHTNLEKIQIQVIPEENTALEMFEQGELDWLGSPLAPLPPDSISSLRHKLRFIPMPASTILAFNTQTFPFQNMKLRKALSLSLNRDCLVSEITAAGQILPMRVLPPSLFEKSLPPLFGFSDPKMARSLFEEALSELSITPADFESLTLYFRPTQMEKRMAQALQREWKDTFGFVIQIQQLDQKTHFDRLHRRDYHIALTSWISQFHDPVNILERFRLASNQKNYAGWENSDYQILLEKAAVELDVHLRLDLLAAAEEIFAHEFPIFPLYHWTSPSLANARLQDIATSPCGGILFERFNINDSGYSGY